jgi:hypothetical protein
VHIDLGFTHGINYQTEDPLALLADSHPHLLADGDGSGDLDQDGQALSL